MNPVKAQHDSAWKEIIDYYLPQALEICFPNLYRQIDWSREWTALDKELQAITKDGETGVRFVDKLVRLYLKDGGEQWVLIHLEVEQEPDEKFPERMFIYGIRLFDKYRCPLASCALLTDSNSAFRPTFYETGLGGSSLRQNFLLCKLIDFDNDRQTLEASSNPFATIILFHLDALKAKKQSPQERLQTKISLTRRMYEKGFPKQEIINIFRFVDFSIALPRLLELEYREEVHQIEASKHMSYISSIERIGREEGIQQGILQGRQEGEGALLLRQLQFKFKTIPDKYQQKIIQADADRLLTWGERILGASTLEEVFADSH